MIETPLAPTSKGSSHGWRATGISNVKMSPAPALGRSNHRNYPKHELLGSWAPEGDVPVMCWKNDLDPQEVSWLGEHILHNQVVFPVAGYVSIVEEAIRQSSNGSLESCTLRDLTVTSVLLLRPGQKSQLRTELRSVSVTRETVQWYEVRIASHDGGHQVEHCVCKAYPCYVSTPKVSETPGPQDGLQRRVAPGYWYDVVASSGLKYGPSFQGLNDISTSLTENKAVATFSPTEDSAKYILHPVAIEQCLQLLVIAALKGQGRKLEGLPIVTFIEGLVVSKAKGTKLKVGAVAGRNGSGTWMGDVSATYENGHEVLAIKNCRVLMVSKATAKSEGKLFSFVKWDTDVVHSDLNKMLAPFRADLDPSLLLERLTLLNAFEANISTISAVKKRVKNMGNVAAGKQGAFGLISDVSSFTELDSTTHRTVLNLHKTQLEGTDLAPLSSLVEQLLTSDAPLIEDRAERKKILNQCSPLYRNNSVLARTIKVLAHKNPKLRILELGNGADETTRFVLNALDSQYGDQLYASYTYATTSSISFDRAKKALKGTTRVDIVSFDVKGQIQSQSLQAGAYDLIITTDFLSPSADVKAGISQLKQLLHPLGRLLLMDVFPEPKWVGLIKSHLQDETLAKPGEFKDEKFISQVHTKLRESDFVFGHEDNDSTTGVKVVAQLKRASKHPKKVSLTVPGYHHPLAREVQKVFQDNGIACERCTFERDLPQGQDIISLADFGDPYLYDMTEAKFNKFVSTLSSLRGSMVWVTPAAQISSKDPNSALIQGMTRTLRAELKTDITLVEVDDEAVAYASASKAILRIYQGLSHRPKAKDADPDYEYAVINGDIKIPRVQWTTREEESSDCISEMARSGIGSPRLGPFQTDQSGPIRLRSDVCYLLVGGLGGLGRMISTWMVENGARCILYLSRSAKEAPQTTPFFDELRSQGCKVATFAGSVNSLSDVTAAVKQAPKPVAGIMQMSGVTRDAWISQMTYDDWDTCVRPKVQGTWNLHHATSASGLDFFLLFSSICGMTGQWGQGNYNAANSFLDAFAKYRHGRGLAASVVDIGFMGGAGMAMELGATGDKLRASGYHFLRERDLLDALALAIARSQPGPDPLADRSQLGLGFRSAAALTSPATRVVWKRDARMVLSHQLGPLGALTDGEAQELLRTAYRDANSSA